MKIKPHTIAVMIVSASLLLLCLASRLQASESDSQTGLTASRDFSTLVVSIYGEEEDLYSEENGILNSQYMVQGKAGERPIKISVYDKDGTPLIVQNAGIRINGTGSRTAIRKSFRIIARAEYDKCHPSFTCDLWNSRRTLDGSNTPIREYSSFILHSVRLGQDATGINNSVGYSLARRAGIQDASPTTPAALYINDVYQGTYFLMPAKTDNALAELYHIEDKDDIQLVSVFSEETSGYQDHPEVLKEYLDFVSYVQHSDVNDPEVMSAIESQLDIHQCLQYYAVNLLLANGDWINNNMMIWRCKNNGLPYQDGKWRFFLFDLDWVGSFPDSVTMNFQQVTQSDEYNNILHCLLQNPKWLAEFREIIEEMKVSAFNADTIEEVIEEENARICQEMAYDFQSDAFTGYLQYSVNSVPPKPEEYLSLQDRELLMEDFRSHLLKAPGKVDECLQTWYPD